MQMKRAEMPLRYFGIAMTASEIMLAAAKHRRDFMTHAAPGFIDALAVRLFVARAAKRDVDRRFAHTADIRQYSPRYDE